MACFLARGFEKSVLTAVHYGEDTDCTAGTIASLFGIMYGIDFFEAKWIDPIGHGIVTCSIDPSGWQEGFLPR